MDPVPVWAQVISNTAKLLAEGQPVKIVCFGDSVTGVYYHTGGRRAWCDLLGVALQRLYPLAQLEMINAGISGHTTLDALRRLETDVLRHAPQLVVVMFGLNDVARVSAEAYRSNLRQLVVRLGDHGAETILMTPNHVFPEDPSRPPAKLGDYVEIVRQTGRELDVPVADAFRAYQSVQTADRWEWIRLMSDPIHPNLRGHRLLAETAAHTITGHRVKLAELPRLQPGLPRVVARWQAGAPVRITAMIPFDALIGPALQTLCPGVQVVVTAWDPTGQSIPELAEQAKGNGWPKYQQQPGLDAPDLMVIAVPAAARAANDEEFYRSYAWILNWSQSFNPPRWDCLAILPSVSQPELDQPQRAAALLAHQVILDKDLPVIVRTPGDNTSLARLLTRQLRSLLESAVP